MILRVDRGINGVDLSDYCKYMSWTNQSIYFPMLPGENHHCLLSYLVNQLPEGSKVADLGTFVGASAIALASNPKVSVYTFDVIDYIDPNMQDKTYRNLSNIRFVRGDCLLYINSFIDAKLILLDIAPHEGSQEKKIVAELQKKDYKGVLVCDDINYSEGMKEFWSTIQLEKFDVTGYGHWSGTGLINFNPKEIQIVVE